MVLYRIEIHPPLLHLFDPTTLILYISGSTGSWKEAIHFKSHDPVKQVSFSMMYQKTIGDIRAVKLRTPRNDRQSNRDLTVIRYLRRTEISQLLKRPQYYALLPKGLHRRPPGQILKTQIVRDCQSFQPGVHRVTLPLAKRYIFSGPAQKTCDGRATWIFELVLSPVYVKISELWPSPLRNQVHSPYSGLQESL
ncbi:hypothetical protein EG68_09846 [Paragonimus skrjabini miyazakii]|uniref:Uncharacterized protein n=1 Tax=Paragonimus skrjabini miyazakii TaxID=59628 RepID=A0A8S9YNY8_9TREM|nr:hypothetical protein EG68_09846 [Paragonimus skrjabini miyazakii]